MRSEGTSSVAFELLIINCQIDFINLFIFNCLTSDIYKFVHIQLFDVKFLFSENHILCKQKRTAVYWRASLVSGFKLIQKNDDLLSLRYKSIFEVPNRILKWVFPTKGIKLTRFVLFGILRVPQVWGRPRTKICEIQGKLWS